MKIEEVTGKRIREEPDAALLNLHRRLHGLWAQHFEGNDKAGTDGLTREDLVNAHVIVRDEMRRRRMRHADEPRDGLDEATCEVAPVKASPEVDAALAGERDDVTVVPNFVAVTGSVGEGRGEAHDLDVLVRADRVEREGGPGFFVRAEDVELPVRKALDPEKTGLPIHWNANPQGPHDAHLALADLVLRWRRPPERQEAKAGRRVRGSRVEQVQALYKELGEFLAELEDFLGWAGYADQVTPLLRAGEPVPAAKDVTESGTGGALVPAELRAPGPALVLTFVGTGAMNSKRRGASLLAEAGGKRVQIDAEKPGDVQPRLDKLLVTDPEAWNAEAAAKAGGEVAAYSGGGLAVRPRKVRHTSHDVHGYLISAGGVRVAYVPELWRWPEWAKNLDLAIVDGSAWKRDIRFAEGAGGHRALSKLVEDAKAHNVGRVVATHVGKPTERALGKREKIEGLEVARDGQRVELRAAPEAKAVAPGRRYEAMKPSMAGVTEYFDTAGLWNGWAEKKLAQGHKLLGSPKIDGFRATISWDGSKAAVWFEDAKEEKTPPGMPKLSGPPFVVEGEFTARRGGEWLARTQLAGAAAGTVEADPHFWLYDVLYYGGEDVSGEPFGKRLEMLRKLKLPRAAFTVLAQRMVADRRGLEAVGRWAAKRPLSEGLFIRQADAPYKFGSTDTAAKLKTVCELKVQVLGKEEKENGWVYRCGLREPGKFANTVEADGGTLVDLGNTFVGPDQRVGIGDTLNVACEELVEGARDGKPILFWGKPTARGPDKSRPAYTARQALDVARRGHILKRELAVKALREEETRGERAEAQWARNWHRLVAKGEGAFILHGHFPALEEEQKDWPLQRLLAANLSYHTDLRHQAPSPFGAWGFTDFEGKSSKVGPKGTRLHRMPPDEPMRGTFKLEQPRQWLQVGKREPYTPEDVGRTGKDYAKFFALDWGKYKLTFAREHSIEMVYDGEKGVVSGRYQINYVPTKEGGRMWQISRPAEQKKIYADDHDLDKVKAELRSKGQRWLFWRESLDAPLQRIRIGSGGKAMDEFDLEGELTDAEAAELGAVVKAAFDLRKALEKALDAMGKENAKGAIAALRKVLENIGEYSEAYGYGYPTPKKAKDTDKVEKAVERAIAALEGDEPDYDKATRLVEGLLRTLGYAEPEEGKAVKGADALKKKLMSAVGQLNKDKPDYGEIAKLLRVVLKEMGEGYGYAEPKKSTDGLAIKILQEDDEGAVVGGHLLRWGDPEQKDLAGDYFTPETELWLAEYKSVPALFHHGLDDKVGLAVVGHRLKAVPDEIGVWVEEWLDKSKKYWQMVKPLLEAKALYFSPGSAPHLVKRDDDGRLRAFPVVEDTMTPIPCQHRLRPIAQIKAAYEDAQIELPDGVAQGEEAKRASDEELLAEIRKLSDEIAEMEVGG